MKIGGRENGGGPRTFSALSPSAALSRLRKLASDTAVYGLSSILGRMLNFLLVPFYTQVFTREEVGVITLVFLAFVFLNILFTYGLESAYLKYASGQEGRARVVEVFSTATFSLLATSAVLGLGIVLFPGVLQGLFGFGAGAPYLVAVVALTLVLDTLTKVPLAELRLAGRPWMFAVANFANIGANILLTLVLVLKYKRGVAGVFEANLMGSVAQLAVLAPLYVQLLRPRFHRAIWRDLVAFGLPFVPGGVGYALTDRVSTIGLQKLPSAVPGASGEALVGLYGAAPKLGVFMMLAVQMFRFAWQPFFLQHADDADARPLFARVFTLFNAGLWAFFLGVAFYAREIATLPLPGGRTLIQASFLPGLVAVPLVLGSYLLQGWYYAFSAGLYIEKQTKYFVHATVAGAVAAIVATVLLVPRLGLVGAGAASVAGYGAMALALYVYAQRAYPLPFNWRRAGGTAALALALFGAWALVPVLQRWFIEGLLLAAYGAGLVALGVVPRGLLTRIGRRPARPQAPPEEPGESARTGAQLADLAADPAALADNTDAPDASAPSPPPASTPSEAPGPAPSEPS